MQLARFLLICVDNAADGSTSRAVYDDDKPVKKIEWEEVAKQQASVLIWNRRHPRQQPLDTPTPRVLSACVQGSASLCHESNPTGADAAKSHVAGPSRLPASRSSCQDAQDVPTCASSPFPHLSATMPVTRSLPPSPPPGHCSSSARQAAGSCQACC